MLRKKLFDTAELVTPRVEVERVGDQVDDDVVADREVRHRAVEPQADLGVVDVQPVDRRVAHRAADAVHLVGVDALADVALDREAGQVDVAAAAVRGVLAVEADAGVHRAVGRRRAEGDLVALDDRVPVAGALDRHVVDDDVAVHLVHARPGCRPSEPRAFASGDGLVEGVGRVPARRSGRRRRAARSRRSSEHARRADELGVEQIDDGPGRVRARGTVRRTCRRPGRSAEQQPLLVVEVHRAERLRERRRGLVKAGTQEHSVTHQSGCSRPAFGSLVNGYWLYSQEYCEVSVMRLRVALAVRP